MFRSLGLRHNVPEYNFGVAGVRWYAETGSARAAARSRARQARFKLLDGSSMRRVLLKTPTAKVASVQAFRQHWAHVVKYKKQVFDLSLLRAQKRSRFGQFMRRQSAMDELCKRVTMNVDPAKVLVFYGAAKCSHGFGSLPSPVVRFRHHLEKYATVIVIDEHYTSQRCSLCVFKPEWITKSPSNHPRLRPGIDRQGDKGKSVHGVRWCSICKTTLPRDINSARLIRMVGMWICRYRSRPLPFHHAGALGSE